MLDQLSFFLKKQVEFRKIYQILRKFKICQIIKKFKKFKKFKKYQKYKIYKKYQKFKIYQMDLNEMYKDMN